ncbi:DNA-directed RNA polymerases II, IV and V subunit 11 [Pelomyxa schiedti]|nr:DNA-directed RNA polymerases II, IV and V subunit 11 [Pelomyxa schiedti]
MNTPDKYDMFVLPPGSQKVYYERESKITDAGTFTIHKEDHTLGNLLRMQLVQDPQVLFAGYKVPHPLEYRILLKVQTIPETTPHRVLLGAIDALHDEVNSLEELVKAEVQRKKFGGH